MVRVPRVVRLAKVAKALGHEVYKRKLTGHLGIRLPVINFLPFMYLILGFKHDESITETPLGGVFNKVLSYPKQSD